MFKNHPKRYGYDETWKDLLISYNGNAITYDAIGNPLRYYNGATMTDWINAGSDSIWTQAVKSVVIKWDGEY